MSIAMTVVLPAPVASLSASRSSPVLLHPLAELRRHLGQPDGGLDRLNLAEEGADALERVVSPMLEQPCRLRRHLPLARIWQVAPVGDVLADFIDDRGRVVLLLGGRNILRTAQDHLLLVLRQAALLRLRHRRDELGAAPALDDAVGRLVVRVQLPMPARAGIGRIQDRALVEGVAHAMVGIPQE
jgi:hypothetical protein